MRIPQSAVVEICNVLTRKRRMQHTPINLTTFINATRSEIIAFSCSDTKTILRSQEGVKTHGAARPKTPCRGPPSAVHAYGVLAASIATLCTGAEAAAQEKALHAQEAHPSALRAGGVSACGAKSGAGRQANYATRHADGRGAPLAWLKRRSRKLRSGLERLRRKERGREYRHDVKTRTLKKRGLP